MEICLLVFMFVKVACVYVLCVLVHRRRMRQNSAEVRGKPCLTLNRAVTLFSGSDSTHVRACKERDNVSNEGKRDNLVTGDAFHNTQISIWATVCSNECTDDGCI